MKKRPVLLNGIDRYEFFNELLNACENTAQYGWVHTIRYIDDYECDSVPDGDDIPFFEVEMTAEWGEGDAETDMVETVTKVLTAKDLMDAFQAVGGEVKGTVFDEKYVSVDPSEADSVLQYAMYGKQVWA